MTVETKPTIDLTVNNFDREVLEVPGTVMVDFWAPWCGPCLKMADVVEDLATKLDGLVTIGKVNVDEHPELGGRFSIRSIPTFLFFQDGKLVGTQVGAVPGELLEAKLTSLDRAA